MKNFNRTTIQWIGFFSGPLFALLMYGLLPNGFSDPNGNWVSFPESGRITAAVAIWMATWWMTEAIAIPATALLPLVVLPLSGSISIKDAASPYGHELIFLFMGGFILALSMQRWNLHKRIAFFALRFVGSSPTSIVGGFMIITAVMSMWVSNTATTIMMLPVAISVIGLIEPDQKDLGSPNFSICLLLGIAYSASIGGVGTLIGTPPNLFLASYIKSHLGMEISFVRWMMVGVPLVLVFLPLVWFLLTRWLYPIDRKNISGAASVTTSEYQKLGPPSRGEWATFIVFCATATLWILRPVLTKLQLGTVQPFRGLTDAGIAMTAALALFVIPIEFKKRTFVMNWETATRLPWGLLILFGGGLSLAKAIKQNAVGELIANQVVHFSGLPVLFLVILVTTTLVFLTELTSNTATTATLVPILAALAPGLGLHPFHLIIPAAIGASCAFMLPVATPPNAIVFGSGKISIPTMVRAGFWFNIIGIALITLLQFTIIIPLLLNG